MGELTSRWETSASSSESEVYPPEDSGRTATAAKTSSSLESTMEMVAETALVVGLAVALDFLAASTLVMVRVL